MDENNNTNNFVWSSGGDNKAKKPSKVKSFLLIFLYSFLLIFFVFIIDMFFLYRENKKFLFDQKASFEIISINVSSHLKEKNIKGLEEDLNQIKKKKSEIGVKFTEYKKKIFFRLFGISNLISRFENLFDIVISISDELLKIQKNYNYVYFKGKLDQNPVKEIGLSLTKLIQLFDNLKKELSSLDVYYIGERFKIKELVVKIDKIEEVLVSVNKYSDLMVKFFGEKGPRSLAVLFQNSNEIRPTGGFIGSFAIVKFNRGRIDSYSLDDVYKYDGQITEVNQAPYEGEKLVGDKSWSLRDANVNPDLIISAQNFNNFYEKAGGETVENFIFLDKKFVSDLLSILGPLHLGKYDIDINSENFDFVMQFFIEGKTKNIFISPKLILLDDFYKAFMAKMKSCFTKENISCAMNLYNMWDVFIKNKSIQIVSLNSEIQKVVESLGLYNSFPKENFIAPVFISISGNKSDKFLKTSYKLTKKTDHEFLFNISRLFEINKSFEEKWNYLIEKYGSDIPEDTLKDILGFGGNRAILQVYVPTDYLLLISELKVIKSGTGGELISYKPKNWQKGNQYVYEFEFPLINNGDKINLDLNFKSNKPLVKDLTIWQQPGLITE